jgi:hypothetical protein
MIHSFNKNKMYHLHAPGKINRRASECRGQGIELARFENLRGGMMRANWC